jgi:hypothetical protein
MRQHNAGGTKRRQQWCRCQLTGEVGVWQNVARQRRVHGGRPIRGVRRSAGTGALGDRAGGVRGGSGGDGRCCRSISTGTAATVRTAGSTTTSADSKAACRRKTVRRMVWQQWWLEKCWCCSLVCRLCSRYRPWKWSWQVSGRLSRRSSRKAWSVNASCAKGR